MARTTVQNTIDRVRRRLSASSRQDLNLLATALVDTTGTAVVYTDVQAAMRAGAIIEIDNELMRVRSVNTGTKTLTVVRGYLDSDAATHLINAEMLVNPLHSQLDIFDAIIAEVLSWGPHLYKVEGTRQAIAAEDEVFALPVGYYETYGIIALQRQFDIDLSDVWPNANFRLIRGVTTYADTSYSTGIHIRLLDGSGEGYIYVTVALPFVTSTWTVATDLVTTGGLAESMLDLLEMGVMLRLLADETSPREATNVQNQPGVGENSPVGATVPPHQLRRQMYLARKNEEIMKLRTKWPIRYS